MIWFACNKCGKRQCRPEASAGTFIFCDCGQGIAVPWQSTAEPDAAAPQLPTVVLSAEPLDTLEPLPPPLPRFNAVPVGEERVPPRPAAPIPFADNKPPPRIDLERGRERDRDRGPRRRGAVRRRDPRFCFNHEERPTEHPCADCGDGFCGDCLVKLQGQLVCGPCKNFRVRKVHGPRRTSLYAVIGVILAGLTGPLAFCLLPVTEMAGNPLVSILALLPQLVALALGVLAIREVEIDQRITGRALALTTLLVAVVSIFLTLFLTLFGSR